MHVSWKGDVCDPKLKSIYKLENGGRDSGSETEEIFEVTICREQKVNQDKLISKYKNLLVWLW